MKQKIYRTKNLELRELRLSDWSAWGRAQETRKPKLNEWDISPVPVHKRTKSNWKRQLTAQRKRFLRDGVFMWSMFLKSTGEFVGWIDISTIRREPYFMANLGWFTLNNHRGQGYAKEATMRLISAAFSDLGFHRLEAAINPRNKPSLRMARSCGLVFEARKKLYLRENDSWHDMMSYITTPELFYERPADRPAARSTARPIQRST